MTGFEWTAGRKSASKYDCPLPWNDGAPKTLVIACSDGRFRAQVDDFMARGRKRAEYDRLYLPGGPAALLDAGFDITRANAHLEEYRFLRDAHGIEELILIFHSGSREAPDTGVCAAYIRRFRGMTGERIRSRQEEDAIVLRRRIERESPRLKVEIVRAEITPRSRVRFVPMAEAISMEADRDRRMRGL